ncbi:hypothetical protein ACK33N_20010 [Aeromonas veronii]|uniref:hypothetical protein n=1 Tax=Aeromonas veronii TaxID=654 RepID=UPI003A4C0686
MKNPTAILCEQFSKSLLPMGETKLLNMLVICAAEYATRSPKRNRENPFIAAPNLIKSLLDSNCQIFEKLYYCLGNHEYLSNIFQNTEQWYSAPHILPELNQYFLYPTSKNSDVEVVNHNLKITQQHILEYEKALADNDVYCEKHPNAVYLTDREKGRIWVKSFENEGRRRAYWLNSNSAPEVFYQLMNSTYLKNIAERQANAPAFCESLLCEELSTPLLFHHGRNWHIDKLADQIKIMIPLDTISEGNGPLRWLEGTTPDVLIGKQQPRSHLHHSFIYSGMKTTIANFLPTSLTTTLAKKECTALAQQDQLILLNTSCIHSGSLTETGKVRKTLTLTYNINSLRNNALNSLPCFY